MSLYVATLLLVNEQEGFLVAYFVLFIISVGEVMNRKKYLMTRIAVDFTVAILNQ